jgi:hypothetical protein
MCHYVDIDQRWCAWRLLCRSTCHLGFLLEIRGVSLFPGKNNWSSLIGTTRWIMLQLRSPQPAGKSITFSSVSYSWRRNQCFHSCKCCSVRLNVGTHYIPWFCRICLMDEISNSNPILELGCNCKGDSSMAHELCIQEWFQSLLISKHTINCEICL